MNEADRGSQRPIITSEEVLKVEVECRRTIEELRIVATNELKTHIGAFQACQQPTVLFEDVNCKSDL